MDAIFDPEQFGMLLELARSELLYVPPINDAKVMDIELQLTVCDINRAASTRAPFFGANRSGGFPVDAFVFYGDSETGRELFLGNEFRCGLPLLERVNIKERDMEGPVVVRMRCEHGSHDAETHFR